jgi:hypothetical protein
LLKKLGDDDDNASDRELIVGAKIQLKQHLKKSIHCYVRGIDETKPKASMDGD